MSLVLDLAKYPLPLFLEGRITPTVYYRWLHIKAATLLKRDKKRRKAYASGATDAVYKEIIHKAVTDGGQNDPYTGDALAWELISTWDSRRDHPEGYKRKFALLPTVDQITPNVLEFEICFWETNDCKADLSPLEFVEFCKRVVKFRS